MTCPKCQGDMRTYERNGVDIDQCTECRGIFLDRGELERLSSAETNYYGGERSSSKSGHRDHDDDDDDDDDDRHRSSSHHGGSHRSKRKESFLGDLFG